MASVYSCKHANITVIHTEQTTQQKCTLEHAHRLGSIRTLLIPQWDVLASLWNWLRFVRSLESFKLIVTFLNGAVLISAEHAKAVGQETRADVCWIAANVVSTWLCEQLIVTERQMGLETYLEGSLSMASAAKEKERENEDRELIGSKSHHFLPEYIVTKVTVATVKLETFIVIRHLTPSYPVFYEDIVT